jgi:hypothetical protein
MGIEWGFGGDRARRNWRIVARCETGKGLLHPTRPRGQLKKWFSSNREGE